MFISPTTAIKNGWIKGIKNSTTQLQPNAIDFTLDKVYKLSDTHCLIGDTSKSMRENEYFQDRDGWWDLMPQKVYDGTSDIYVEVPSGVCAMLYTRSTFARNGVFITSGLYDSGYKGHIGFTIYTIGGSISIQKGTRIGQIAFLSADSAYEYQGQWNHQQGTHYTTTQTAQPSASPYGDFAKKLEETTKWDSDQAGKPAGTKSFL